MTASALAADEHHDVFMAEMNAKKEWEGREAAEDQLEAASVRRGIAEGRIKVVPYEPFASIAPQRSVAPSQSAFVKDASYWKRFYQLQSEGRDVESAHRSAMARSNADADLRAIGIEPRDQAPGFSPTPRARPNARNDNQKPVLLQTYRASDFVDVPIPPRTFLVPDLIPKGKTALLSGDGGAGKSLLGLMLGSSVSTGEPWIGLPVEEGTVLYLAAEDDLDELRRRLADIAGSQDATRHLDKLHLAPLVGIDPILGALDRQTGRIAETEMFKALRLKIGELQPVLLILDTLADLFDGDEIKKEQARGFMAMLNRLAAATGVTIVMLSHPSQSGMASGTGTSGNSAWSNSVRSRLYLQEHESDPEMRILTLKKANYARAGIKILIRLHDGRFERVDERQQQADDLGEAKSEFLRLLAELIRQGQQVSHKPSPTYAPKLFHETNRRITKRKFIDAMNELLRTDAIKIEEEGPPSRRHSYLVIANATAGPPSSPAEDDVSV